MTACSFLHLLLLRISYSTMLGLEMLLSDISVKYSEENLGLPGRLKDWGIHQTEISRICCGLGHSLRRTA